MRKLYPPGKNDLSDEDFKTGYSQKIHVKAEMLAWNSLDYHGRRRRVELTNQQKSYPDTRDIADAPLPSFPPLLGRQQAQRRSCRAVWLGWVRPCCPSLTVSTGDLQKRPPPPVHRIPQSPWVNSMDECLNMAESSPSLEDDEALADSQEHPGRVAVVHTKRYAVEKAWDLLIGVFSSMFLCGQHDSVPTLSASRMPRSSMILKVVSTKGRATLRFVLAQPVLIIWSFLTGYLSTQSRKEIQISALQESSQSQSKRMRAKKKKDLITLGKGEGSAKQEKDSPVTKRPSGQGKDSDGDVSAPSAFGRLIVNNVLSSFTPRPGPLGGDICFKNSAKSYIKKSQIAFKSSYKRNAIASSYSSTLAQWPPERIYARDTRAAASGAATELLLQVLPELLLQARPQVLLHVHMLPEVLPQMLLQVLLELLLQMLPEVLPQMLLQVLLELLLQVLPEVLPQMLLQVLLELLLQMLLELLLQVLPEVLPQMLLQVLLELMLQVLPEVLPQMLLQVLLELLLQVLPEVLPQLLLQVLPEVLLLAPFHGLPKAMLHVQPEVLPLVLLQVLSQVLLQVLLQMLPQVLSQVLLQMLPQVLPQVLSQVLPQMLLQVVLPVLPQALFQGLLQTLCRSPAQPHPSQSGLQRKAERKAAQLQVTLSQVLHRHSPAQPRRGRRGLQRKAVRKVLKLQVTRKKRKRKRGRPRKQLSQMLLKSSKETQGTASLRLISQSL
ncbi:uncharacterized protein LOC128122608 [Peromyscus californicus insignis]|uniref:uncharacterized protein LOC128122608 n=1 Tax=Peromyscus californicus insignis TaxID=564181 RepID=UPI0022A6CC24|nr:uncharacterized protein LOC128122608 [Peromyscus californicus insignis]